MSEDLSWTIDHSIDEQILYFKKNSSQKIVEKLSTKFCREKSNRTRRESFTEKTFSSSTSIVTFNSSSFIDFQYSKTLDFPLRLSLRFRTIGRVNNGVLFSFTSQTALRTLVPFIIAEHTNGKVDLTILQLSQGNVLTTVTVSFRFLKIVDFHQFEFLFDFVVLSIEAFFSPD